MSSFLISGDSRGMMGMGKRYLGLSSLTMRVVMQWQNLSQLGWRLHRIRAIDHAEVFGNFNYS